MGADAQNASPDAVAMAVILAELSVRITDAPAWWRESKGGLEMADDNVITAIYENVRKIVDFMRKKLIPRTPTLDLFTQPAQAPAASLALVGGTSSEGDTTAPAVVPVAPITPAESTLPASAALQTPAHHQPAPKGRRIYSKGLTA